MKVALFLILVGFMGCAIQYENKYIPIEYQGEFIYTETCGELEDPIYYTIIVSSNCVTINHVEYQYTLHGNILYVCKETYLDDYVPVIWY